MQIDFSNFSTKERPILVLKNAHEDVLGVLGTAFGIKVNATFNELSTMSFSVPAETDGEETPYYDKVEAMRIVQLVGIGQFIINKVSETNDGVKRIKACDCYSLEYELSRKKITIPKGTYKFYSASSSDETLMSMVMEELPSWHIGTIPSSLINKYRTYEVANTTIYDFLKNTVQQSYNCIFTFDTDNRTINIIDAQNMPVARQVFLSNDNLAKEIKIDENIDNIVTRLDVTGAEDVNIRDVNPTGTNKIIDLSYYMNTDNFEQELIDKYNAWVSLVDGYRDTYYMLTLQYSAASSLKISQDAELVELQGELTSLENLRGTYVQAVAEMIPGAEDNLAQVNRDIASKNSEIAAKRTQIAQTQASIADYQQSLRSIVTTCSLSNSFTSEELAKLDKYYKDGEVQDSSFTLSNTASYVGTESGVSITSKSVSITGAEITKSVIQETGRTVYDIKGGTLSVAGLVSAYIVSAVLDVGSGTNPAITFTSYLNYGVMTESSQMFPSGCITISGTGANITSNCAPDAEIPEILTGTSVSFNATGFYYFTSNTSEYQKRYVAYELYEYGREMLTKLAQPTYTFSITSANFLNVEGFETFKNDLRLGDTVYVRLDEKLVDGIMEARVINPICIGVEFSYDDLSSLSLKFSDSFVSSDSVFRLTDLLKESVSTSKTVEASKYAYGEWVDKNANNEILDYMRSALDVSKNAILSSTGQAITWDDAGIRLRKVTSTNPLTYSDKQIWMNNNSIVMTNDNWNSATMAIGEFKDSTTGGTYWGINAERVFGTIIAGQNLWIQCPGENDTMLFKVDGNGVSIYNGEINMVSGNRQVYLNPALGIVIGKNPVVNAAKTAINSNNAYFYADDQGNLHIKGAITATSGEFTGTIHASSGEFSGDVTAATLTLQSAAQTTVTNLVKGTVDAAYIRAKTAGQYTYTGATQPTGGTYYAGDSWYNTSNHSVYRCSGSSWMRVTPQVITSSTYPGASGFIEGDRWKCTASVTSGGVKYFSGNVYQWNGSKWDGISGEVRTSGIEITPEYVTITTSEFDVNIQDGDTEKTELAVDKNGVVTNRLAVNGGEIILKETKYKENYIVEHYDRSDLNSGSEPYKVVYITGSGGVSQLDTICDHLSNKHLKEDVVIKMPWASVSYYPVLRNVSGARVIFMPFNLAESMNGIAWVGNGCTVTRNSAANYTVTVSTAGTNRYATLRLGTVSSLGLLGKRLYAQATYTQTGAGAQAGIIVVLSRRGATSAEKHTAILNKTNSNIGDGYTGTLEGYVDIPDRGVFPGVEDAEVLVQLRSCWNTAGTTSTSVRYSYFNLTISGGQAGQNAFPGYWGCAGAILDNCSSEIIFTNALFSGYLSAMNSNFILNRCNLMIGCKAALDNAKNPPSIQQYGGRSSLRNCDGGGKSNAVNPEDLSVYARVRGGGYMGIEGTIKPYGTPDGNVSFVDYIAEPGGTDAPDTPTTRTGQVTLSATNHDTWIGSSWLSADDDVRQGSTSGNSNMRGWVYFAISGLPSGSTITSATMKFKRVSGYGKGSPVDVTIYKSSTTSKGSSAPSYDSSVSISNTNFIDEGESKSVNVTSMLSGTSGLAVVFYKNEAAGSSGYSTNFARFKGDSFKLILNYTYPA